MKQSEISAIIGCTAALLCSLAVASAQTLPPSAPSTASNNLLGTFSNLAAAGANGGSQAATGLGEQLAQQQLESKLKLAFPSLGEDAPDWLKRTEVHWGFFQRGKPDQSILTVQPLFQSEKKQDTIFVQGSLYHYAMFGEYRWTGNLGVGYRRLLQDNTIMLGTNGFIDDEFTNGHRRLSIGAEAKWGPLDLTFNNYFAITGDKTVNGNIERALGGRDVELRSQVPFVPWAKVSARYYTWDAVKATRDMQGPDFAAEFFLHPNFSVEVGRSDDDFSNNVARGQTYVLLHFHLAVGNQPSLTTGPIVSDKIFETRDLTNETLTKVRRENRIIVERRTSGGVVISRGN